MAVTLSVCGTRIDCDNCGQHTSSPDLTTEQLRAATGYVRADGTHGWDLCPEVRRQAGHRRRSRARAGKRPDRWTP